MTLVSSGARGVAARGCEPRAQRQRACRLPGRARRSARLARRERGGSAFEEETIVAYLDALPRRAQPAPATYYRRFALLRRFFRWLSRRSGVPDPFLELEPPPKPQQEADWLTAEEFARCSPPPRARSGARRASPSATGSCCCARVDRPSPLRADRARLGRPRARGPRPRCLSAVAKAASRAASRSPAARARARGSCDAARSRQPTSRSSAASPAVACSRRSSPTSSAAPPRAPASRSTSPRTRCATPPPPGCARRPATRAWSPPTSATPTSRPSAATPTSPTRRAARGRRRDRRATPPLADGLGAADAPAASVRAAGRSVAGTARVANGRAPAPSGSTETAAALLTGNHDDSPATDQ